MAFVLVHEYALSITPRPQKERIRCVCYTTTFVYAVSFILLHLSTTVVYAVAFILVHLYICPPYIYTRALVAYGQMYK